MVEIRYVQLEDKEFWYRLDSHLPEQEFNNKVSDKKGYVLLDDNKPIGLLRYNLFWDNTPFCTMLFIDWNYHGKGYGKKLMEHWENDMKSLKIPVYLFNPLKTLYFQGVSPIKCSNLMYFPLFLPLRAKTRETFLFSAGYFIQQSCGSTLRFPCSVSVNVHCGTDISV